MNEPRNELEDRQASALIAQFVCIIHPADKVNMCTRYTCAELLKMTSAMCTRLGGLRSLLEIRISGDSGSGEGGSG